MKASAIIPAHVLDYYDDRFGNELANYTSRALLTQVGRISKGRLGLIDGFVNLP